MTSSDVMFNLRTARHSLTINLHTNVFCSNVLAEDEDDKYFALKPEPVPAPKPRELGMANGMHGFMNMLPNVVTNITVVDCTHGIQTSFSVYIYTSVLQGFLH